ncbi:MAG: hypothetical protein GY863_09865 [bacterium]|nr:hypothetical protein [bacterium]
MKKIPVLLLFSAIGWILCGLVMWTGMVLFSIETTLIIHLIAAPVFFIVLSLVYFRKFNHTSPLYTAVFFISAVIFLDVFIVSMLIEKNFDMFRSPIGTWIPFLLIFLATYFTGVRVGKSSVNDS